MTKGTVLLKIKQGGSQKKPLMIIAGVAVSKKATERNLLKRRVKAIMRPIMKETPQKDFTIILHSEAKKLSYNELKNTIENLAHGKSF